MVTLTLKMLIILRPLRICLLELCDYLELLTV